MEKQFKFIIEDDTLYLDNVYFHKEIAKDVSKVKGGGMFRFDKNTNTITFYGKSEDFGHFNERELINCIYNNKVKLYYIKDISLLYNFNLDIGSEIITIRSI